MQRTLRRLFLTIEINLLLWLVLFGQGAPAKISSETSFWQGEVSVSRSLIMAGFAFSLIAHHWAYYAVYRKAKAMQRKDE
jgi:hypothetical protein